MGRFKITVFCLFYSLQLLAQLDSSHKLIQSIDSIIEEGLVHKAFPGAQLYISHLGKSLISKSYGYHTYDSIRNVRPTDFYDLASITKVSTGLPILMKLFGEGKLDLDNPLSNYFHQFSNSNKESLTIRNILSHQSGLQPYIVYWAKHKKRNGELKRNVFRDKRSKKFSIEITENLFLKKNYQKKLIKYIKATELDNNPSYKYSGLFFQILPNIIENITGQQFENYLKKEIYEPLGIKNLMYNPTKYVKLNQIVPTEYDSTFRKQLVHGKVHDEAAAMLNGISCNAGLFGNAEELGKLFQFYLEYGVHQGIQLIDSTAIAEFTRCQFCPKGNRRGLGFDKPLIEYEAGKSHVAQAASSSSFGHSGFTGTFVWADPETDLVIVFLCNRVYPTRKNRELYKRDIRPRLQAKVYEYLGNKNKD